MILAITSRGDLTTDYVIRAAEHSGATIARINTNDLLEDWRFYFDGSAIRVRNDEREIDPTRVTAVYYRRAYPAMPTRETSADAFDFVSREARVCLQALYDQLECPWTSHHVAIRLAENKPRQLRLANSLGFNVPQTVVTNEMQVARTFIERNGWVVTKPLSHGDLGLGNIMHTSLLKEWDEDWAGEIHICPTLFQQYINKKSDIRVTVVSERVFACRIYSQENPAYSVDMRRGLSDPRLRHELIELPSEVTTNCVQIVKQLGLRFGAIDLAEDHAGALWFLEVNPNGQWAWIQDKTGANIAGALIEQLEGSLK